MITEAELEDPRTELKLWLAGKRSTNNFIVGTLGDYRAEARLIAESDNARIIALAALVTSEPDGRFYNEMEGSK